jgi:hypothetical protein
MSNLLGLGLTWAGFTSEMDGRDVLREAATLAEGYDDSRDDDVEIVQEVADRPLIRQYYTEVSDVELAAVRRLLDEAQDYWVANDYTSDGDDETGQMLGFLADAGHVKRYGQVF